MLPSDEKQRMTYAPYPSAPLLRSVKNRRSSPRSIETADTSPRILEAMLRRCDTPCTQVGEARFFCQSLGKESLPYTQRGRGFKADKAQQQRKDVANSQS